MMFIELFVGTLTRYYSEQWQNRRTREGAESPFASPTDKNAVSDPVELQGIVTHWREDTSSKLKEHLSEPLTWQEGMLPPYHVGEIGFHGYGGVILLTAYTSPSAGSLPRPTEFQKTWNGDPAFEAIMKDQKKNTLWEIINCSIWLPSTFQFGIGMKDPSGQPARAGSIDVLWKALEYLNETNWNAAPERIAEWANHKLDDTVSFDVQAQFGFSVFYDMCRRARENRTPMKLHY
jgi:hypothetical protein